jgi:hypothetical protein
VIAAAPQAGQFALRTLFRVRVESQQTRRHGCAQGGAELYDLAPGDIFREVERMHADIGDTACHSGAPGVCPPLRLPIAFRLGPPGEPALLSERDSADRSNRAISNPRMRFDDHRIAQIRMRYGVATLDMRRGVGYGQPPALDKIVMTSCAVTFAATTPRRDLRLIFTAFSCQVIAVVPYSCHCADIRT